VGRDFEDISFVYPPDSLPAAPAGQDVTIGAERPDGKQGGSVPQVTSDLQVITTPPVAGGRLELRSRFLWTRPAPAAVTARASLRGSIWTASFTDRLVPPPTT
jgi:hypothetical protein